MKATVTLTGPEQEFIVEIDAWARLMVERNAVKFGFPAMESRAFMHHHPEGYMCMCAYFTLHRSGEFPGTYPEFESRWGGLETDEPEGDELSDPTAPGL